MPSQLRERGFKTNRVLWVILVPVSWPYTSGLWRGHAGTTLESSVLAICILLACILIISFCLPVHHAQAVGIRSATWSSPIKPHPQPILYPYSCSMVACLWIRSQAAPSDLEPHSVCAQGTSPCPLPFQIPLFFYRFFLSITMLGTYDQGPGWGIRTLAFNLLAPLLSLSSRWKKRTSASFLHYKDTPSSNLLHPRTSSLHEEKKSPLL